VEIDITTHKSGLVPRHHSVAVSEADDVVRSGQLDQWNAAAGFVINDRDSEVIGCGRRASRAIGKGQQKKPTQSNLLKDSAGRKHSFLQDVSVRYVDVPLMFPRNSSCDEDA
jgi:hypothetical protein